MRAFAVRHRWALLCVFIACGVVFLGLLGSSDGPAVGGMPPGAARRGPIGRPGPPGPVGAPPPAPGGVELKDVTEFVVALVGILNAVGALIGFRAKAPDGRSAPAPDAAPPATAASSGPPRRRRVPTVYHQQLPGRIYRVDALIDVWIRDEHGGWVIIHCAPGEPPQ